MRYSPRNAPLIGAAYAQWDPRLKDRQPPDLAELKSSTRMRGSDIMAAPANHSAGAAIPGRHAGAR